MSPFQKWALRTQKNFTNLSNLSSWSDLYKLEGIVRFNHTERRTTRSGRCRCAYDKARSPSGQQQHAAANTRSVAESQLINLVHHRCGPHFWGHFGGKHGQTATTTTTTTSCLTESLLWFIISRVLFATQMWTRPPTPRGGGERGAKDALSVPLIVGHFDAVCHSFSLSLYTV